MRFACNYAEGRKGSRDHTKDYGQGLGVSKNEHSLWAEGRVCEYIGPG